MKKFFSFFMMAAMLLAAGCRSKIDPGDDTLKYVLATVDADNITNASARILGKVVSMGQTIGEVGFVYDKAGKLNTKTSPRESTVPVEDGQFWVTLNGLEDETVYEYVAYAIVDGEEAFGKTMSFKTLRGVPQNAVDMGTGVYWAKCNLGAATETDPGDYYSWGETETKSTYSDANYLWGDPVAVLKMYKYNADDGLTVLEPSDDAATKKLKQYWRIPTKEEWEKLIEKCNPVKAEIGSVKGVKFTSSNGNTLFIPCSGWKINSVCTNSGMVWAWSSNVGGPGYYSYAYAFYYNYEESGSSLVGSGTLIHGRRSGHPIRPVSD